MSLRAQDDDFSDEMTTAEIHELMRLRAWRDGERARQLKAHADATFATKGMPPPKIQLKVPVPDSYRMSFDQALGAAPRDYTILNANPTTRYEQIYEINHIATNGLG